MIDRVRNYFGFDAPAQSLGTGPSTSNGPRFPFFVIPAVLLALVLIGIVFFGLPRQVDASEPFALLKRSKLNGENRLRKCEFAPLSRALIECPLSDTGELRSARQINCLE